jgi:DNA repair exonuclease SbcCD ATPase subunit
MKILQLTAQNVKRLTVVEIKPDGNLVQITGRNGQGKTSVLDSIWWALAGADNIQAQPIRKGESKARIELTLGDGKTTMIVERRFTEKGSTVSVKTADGAKYGSPQKLLDELLGKLTFDPLNFMRQKPADQVDVLRRMVPLDVNVEELDRERSALFERRTAVNRRASDLTARAGALRVPDDAPVEEIDTAPLLDRLTSADRHNALIRTHENTITQTRAEIAGIAGEIADLERQLSRKRAQLDAGEAQLNHLLQVQMPAPIDAQAVRAELQHAEAVNVRARQRRERDQLLVQAKAEAERADGLTQRMADLDEQKRAAIACAPMPVPGLGFGDDVVTFNGLPLDQASDAEQLKVSTAIAAALNPKLRVIRIRDGSLLDDTAMQWLAGFADERDFQIWVERVDGSGTVGVVMEDGHVRGQEPTAEAAE